MYSPNLTKKIEEKKIKAGDRVKLVSKLGSFEGILIPRSGAGDPNTIILKQNDGYNVGIKFTSDMEIEKVGTSSEKLEIPKKKVASSASLPQVSLLYTGGTIGSKVDYVSGGVYMLTKPEELLAEVPELEKIANIDVEHLMSRASEDMGFKDMKQVGEETAKAFNKGAVGVVITHGTDTMHFTSAALSFMLSNLKGPVVITGAQRSSDRGSSDAFMNLTCAAYVASRSDAAEVGTCMHSSSSDDFCHFIRGTKVRKMHTSRRDAFKAINDVPIAKVYSNGQIDYLSKYRKRTDSKEKTVAKIELDSKVELVYTYPNADPSIIEHHMSRGAKGIIIAGTGLGHTPVAPAEEKFGWIPYIKKAVDAGVIVGVTSQCLYGRVNPSVYRNLRAVSGAGAIYCEDMMPDVAYMKLSWLLGNYKKDEAATMLNKNLVGEITSRTTFDEF